MKKREKKNRKKKIKSTRVNEGSKEKEDRIEEERER